MINYDYHQEVIQIYTVFDADNLKILKRKVRVCR